MARDGFLALITCKMTTTATSFFSLYNMFSLLTLFFFLVTTVMAEDRQVEPNSLQGHPHQAIKKIINILKPLSTERRSSREEDQISSTITMGRKGKHHHEYPKVHHQKSYLWRDKSLSVAAHEVPSGPNPISNR
ncbi:hypothetical protein HAX54_017595 [Datura stramonium]|uniref:Uncharacterized protein n=1 Tax=Datura stramonium TaxID=4076 RepID=A0ABS8S0P2_DATST|nr:hypothetical protein [Datura stramonium]